MNSLLRRGQLFLRKGKIVNKTAFKHTRTDILRLLKLRSFDDSELQKSFESLQEINSKDEQKTDTVNVMKSLLKIQPDLSGDASSFATLLKKEKVLDKPVNVDEYKEFARGFGESLDRRIYSIATSFLFTGVSVGIVIPCMPLLISELQLPPSDMGMVVSAFGLSKLLANMPSAYFVDRYGRKPAIGIGLTLCGLGIGAISMTLLPGFGSSWLIGCRLLSGVGVSAFLAGGFMFVSDISTNLNRTRTIAPVMASFHAGSALGPALGGVLVQHLGLAYTYATVGMLFVLNAATNQLNVSETRPPQLNDRVEKIPGGLRPKLNATIASWKELLTNPRLKDIIVLNGAYWFVWSGAQMTLLPLFLVSNPVYSLSPAELGGYFAASSVVSFLSAQPIAYIADKYSKPGVLITGLGLISACIAVLPHTLSLHHLFTLLVPLSLGSTIVNALPTSIATDSTTESERAQALSLMRTAGDMGLLAGASTAGLIATQFDLSTAFMFDGGIMGAAMLWYGYRWQRGKH